MLSASHSKTMRIRAFSFLHQQQRCAVASLLVALLTVALAAAGGVTAQATTTQTVFDEAKFTSLVQKVEGDALELARKVEELYKNRCSLALLADCSMGNYDHCISSYPDESCPGGDVYNTPQCGDGISCSALYSFSITNVVLPQSVANGEGGNPTDPQVIETICFTKQLDQYFIAKRAADAPFWEQFGVQPTNVYFGSINGAFRIFPAQHYSSCNTYDPRIRPWYVAASSGPKNIVMILDQSGSMQESNKIGVLKEAAKRVIGTSSVGDRIAVIPFNDVASKISNNGYMYIATQENKDKLIAEIDKMSAFGGTNFYDAFTAAFEVLDRSIDSEATVQCNTAILFLTDGRMTLPKGVTEQDVMDLVASRLNNTSHQIEEPIYVFTYSVSGGNPEVDEFPRKLACSTGGVWSKIENEDDIVESLSSYYKFFALGLGTGANKDFTAWVEPYVYIPGDTVGTTVSAPVFDRTKTPNLFLGVVGIDFTLDALDAALGIQSGTDSNESFRRIVQRSTAICPALNLTTCELESYRRQGTVGDQALCSNVCKEADFVQVEEEKCPAVDDYPHDLWKNRLYQNVDFLDKVCCRVGEAKAGVVAVPDSTCFVKNRGNSNVAVIVGCAGGGAVVFLAVLGSVAWWRKRNKRKSGKAPIDSPNGTDENENIHTEDATATDAQETGTQPNSPSSVGGANTVLPVAHAEVLEYKDQCRQITQNDTALLSVMQATCTDTSSSSSPTIRGPGKADECRAGST
jgi:Mg-chelatase subunit ChlD